MLCGINFTIHFYRYAETIRLVNLYECSLGRKPDRVSRMLCHNQQTTMVERTENAHK